MEHAQAEWDVLKGAPIASLIALLLISGATWAANSWAYSAILSQKDAAISGQQTTITNLNSTIGNLHAEIADLRNRVGASPAPAQSDPDVLYQLGSVVAQVTGASVNRAEGIVQFATVIGSADLNIRAETIYRQFRVSACRYALGNAMVNMGVLMRQTYRQVTCQIVGNQP